MRALPKPLCIDRCALLPLILEEWSRVWPDHLSIQSQRIKSRQINKLEVVIKHARGLQEALNEIGETGRIQLLAQMTHGSLDISRHEFNAAAKWLEQESDFLEKLTAVDPKDFWKPKRGRPRNLSAYLVLQDAAAIFEWLTGIKATREVSRDNKREIGPFFDFLSILWPTIFDRGRAGLPAAMKNWAELRKAHNEQSALIVNIALRQPEWGIFERSSSNTAHVTKGKK